MSMFLMEPGPTQVDRRVLEAMARPVIHHQSAEFTRVVDNVCTQLQLIYQTSGEIVVLPATGRGGLEAALGSVADADAPLVVPTNGTFGRMMVFIAKRLGLTVHEIPFAAGEPFDRSVIEEALKTLHRPILGIVHNETSPGVINDPTGYGALVHEQGGLFLLDTVSSLGGTAVNTDAHGVDLCVSATQKAMGALAGLSFVAVSERAKASLDTPAQPGRGAYLDLRRWWEMWLPADRGGSLTSGFRRLPWSMPTSLVVALDVACDVMFEEGLTNRWKRHNRAGLALREALTEVGLTSFVRPGMESPTVTAVHGIDDIDLNALRRALAERHNISVAGGMDVLSGKILRIGHMAQTARLEPQVKTVEAIGSEVTGSDSSAAIATLRKAWGSGR